MGQAALGCCVTFPMPLGKCLCASSFCFSQVSHSVLHAEAPILFLFLYFFNLQVDLFVVIKYLRPQRAIFLQIMLSYLTFWSEFKFYSKIRVVRKPIILRAELVLCQFCL